LAIFEKSKALGLYALNIPEQFGGGGLSNLDRIICEEQFGHTSDYLIRRAFGNVYEPLLECKGAQVDRWLKPTVEGVRTCSIAITESGAGSDAAGIKTTARKTEAGWVLNGSKCFISDGLWSDFYLVSAKTGEKEISMFMVDKGLPGFTIGKDQKMMGLRGTPHLELYFDDVVLEPVCLLGEQGQGFKLAMGALNVVRLAQVGARAVGKASHVLELMLDYVNERKQFGQKIGDFQMVQQQIADSVIEVNAARWMVYQAAWMLDQGLMRGNRSPWSRCLQPRCWARWWTARFNSSVAWVFARNCRLSAITAMRVSTASLTAPAKSTAPSWPRWP